MGPKSVLELTNILFSTKVDLKRVKCICKIVPNIYSSVPRLASKGSQRQRKRDIGPLLTFSTRDDLKLTYLTNRYDWWYLSKGIGPVLNSNIKLLYSFNKYFLLVNTKHTINYNKCINILTSPEL